MSVLPPLDLHAHVDVRIDPLELVSLKAVVCVATRSLDEAELALQRSDPVTIWGVGCHPGLAKAHRDFDGDRFGKLISATPYVGELGLDGDSPVSMQTQRQTLEAALSELRSNPRITSLHSYKATDELLTMIENNPLPGLVLHWWTGSERQTARAIELGCFFSVNRLSMNKPRLVAQIPLDRVLPETDHPFGDKGSGDRRPGGVGPVEAGLAKQHGCTSSEIRLQYWRTFSRLIDETGTSHLLPPRVQRLTAALAG